MSGTVGRPPGVKLDSQVVVRLSTTQHEELRKLAAMTERTPAQVMRLALREFLKQPA